MVRGWVIGVWMGVALLADSVVGMGEANLVWGAFRTVSAGANVTDWLIPAPYEPGNHTLQVLLLSHTIGTPFVVGTASQDPTVTALLLNASNSVPLTVAADILADIPALDCRTVADQVPTAFGMQYELWNTLHNNQYTMEEAIPLIGNYGSNNERALRLHAFWLRYAGIHFVMIDWSNNVFGLDNWQDLGQNMIEIMQATTNLLTLYHNMSQANQVHPCVTLLLGLDNGPVAKPDVFQDEIDWIFTNYLTTPKATEMLNFRGYPLVTILDTAGSYTKGFFNDSGLTVRLMGAQLQGRPDLVQRGYWSWMSVPSLPLALPPMDGSLQPTVAQYCDDSSHCMNEAMTITNAFFNGGGWLAPTAQGKEQGTTFLEQMKYMAQAQPKVVLVCQWNEFIGQSEGSTTTYVDIYNSTLGNDMEPTDLVQCAYQRPDDLHCGGWLWLKNRAPPQQRADIGCWVRGYRSLNMLRGATALMSDPEVALNVMFTVQAPLNFSSVEAADFAVTLDTLFSDETAFAVVCSFNGQSLGADLAHINASQCVVDDEIHISVRANTTSRYGFGVEQLNFVPETTQPVPPSVNLILRPT
ncbi:uncharacterized protein MONBRDRAFT_28297 [Monosiga brevicollis MX1]|uniref:Uncharacterized protein n=1 Tax=Monosiga brevicollis TaxID=81824 RepID=A9V7R8_MONBE|nr:uncharacterized protein MONBRDRAFT_28297 [Monosiga brevicollis MX1]EDQ86421.1 predicted protein [Monosiga brevicollis MX1]|eukprot:XP_001748811.1 hypothetical protein [Monosiga brevicollis MX1]